MTILKENLELIQKIFSACMVGAVYYLLQKLFQQFWLCLLFKCQKNKQSKIIALLFTNIF